MKTIWSKRYGTNPIEGVHKYLEQKIKGYKRNDLHKYTKGFNVFIEKPTKANSGKLAADNFQKFKEFISIYHNA